jgi:hypothetical protein
VISTCHQHGSFSDVRPALGTAFEANVLKRLYDDIPISGFSEVVMQQCAANHPDARRRVVRSWSPHE